MESVQHTPLQLRRKLPRQIRRPNDLKGAGGAPAFRHVGALEEPGARVDHGRLKGRHVGARHDPR